MNPLFVSLNYGFRDCPWLQFSVEPFYARGYAPERSFESGINVALQFMPVTLAGISPYLRGAVGGVYFSQKTLYQRNGLNFDEYAGVGAHFFCNSPVNLVTEFRVRHISNADFASPNVGINTLIYLAGVRINF